MLRTGDPPPRPGRSPAIRSTLLVILVLNLVVVALKVAIGVRTGALTVLGAALESTLDVVNNFVGIALVAVAARAPDEDHPYGHDKFETLGALAIVGFLSISCFELLRESIETLHVGGASTPATVAEIVALASTALINFFVVWFERKRGRELASAFLLADAQHTQADLYVTGLAVGSLLLTRAGVPEADPLLAIVVAALIARSGYHILRGTVPVLVDERGVEAERIRTIVRSIDGIESVRDVRSRANASGTLFAELTIIIEGAVSVAAAHQIADDVEGRIEAELGASEVTVHIEPA
ncbi:MAG: cation diffusion facilitator family transporter [Gemmatimonadaceae bacterium]